MTDKNSDKTGWSINNGVEGFDLSSLPRCCGTAKTTGKPCQRAAKKGHNFCGIHSGNYTPGQKKGAQPRLKHGFYTQTAKQERKTVNDLICAIHGTIGTIKEEVDNTAYGRDVIEYKNDVQLITENKKEVFMRNFQTITMQYFEGKCPESQEMHVADRNGRTVGHEIARHRCLPKDPSVWTLSDNNGWSVAHEAARYGNLPPDFSRWEIKTDDGRTVAHEAAARGDLPKGFKDFWMCDLNGWMVAHECASNAKLPEGFDSWKAFTERYPVNYTGIAVSDALDGASMFPPNDFVHSGKITLEPSMEYSGEDLFLSLSKYLEAYGIASITPVNTAPDNREPYECLLFQPWTREDKNLALFCEIVSESFEEGMSCFCLIDYSRGFTSENGDWGIVVPLRSAALVFENIVELMSRFYLYYSSCLPGLSRKPLVRVESEMPNFTL